MATCINHPDREARFVCMKHEIPLCEECLECRDPNLYCKFRTSCPIWFMQKRKQTWDAEEREAEVRAKEQIQVTFAPNGQTAMVDPGATLLDAARAVDVPINASCNGKGSCGKCKLIVDSGDVETTPSPLLTDREKEKGYVLACQTVARGNASVRIPPETAARRLRAAGMGEAATARLKGLVPRIWPMLQQIPLELAPPDLNDSVSDLDRLSRGLRKAGVDTDRLCVGLPVVRDLAAAMRNDADANFHLTAHVARRRCSYEVVRVTPGDRIERCLGLAIDVGTTSIVVYLVDMEDGAVLAAASGHNRQAACGDDVINRIVCAEKNGVKKLSVMAISTINSLIREALAGANEDKEHIRNVVLSGNTTMAHLLLGIEPRYIRRAPYIPTVSEFPIVKAGEIGLVADPLAAIFAMPGPAAYVGGDIVSGLLYAGFHRETPLTLFIDIGTNGEIVLGNEEWLLTASCSAGPAFEGGGIRWGMRAEPGAIENVTIDPAAGIASYNTVESAPARGICGSGMIDLISEMLVTGVIDPNGRFRLPEDHPRMTKHGDEWVYVVAGADATEMGDDIVFSESDIDNLMRSKGAVYAGFTVLLNEAGLDFSMVDRVYITGGFGEFLNIDKAVIIGLLPDIDRSKFKYLGNSSAAGAYMALLSEDLRKEAIEVCNKMTYIDFSSNPRFMDEFTSALFLPHTDLKAFPSVKARRTEL